MIHNHLPLLRLNRAYKAGMWTEELLQQAWSHWETSPGNFSLMLLINIQHSLRGFTQSETKQLIEQAKFSCKKLSTASQMRLAALELEQQLNISTAMSSDRSLAPYPHLLDWFNRTNSDDLKSDTFQPKDLVLQQRAKNLVECLVEWDDYARYLRSKSIAVVGNAPSGLGQKMGQQIDQADVVIRFNQVNTQGQYTADYGSKTNIWVISPGFKPDPTTIPAQTLVVSGVSPFHKPTQYWKRLAQLPVERVLTYPPRIWYRLVRKLEAPPTAGLLTLASLKESLDDCTKVLAVGFSEAPESLPTNHYGDSGKRSTRHNWEGEASMARELIASLHNAVPTDLNTLNNDNQAASQKSS